jgi:RNA polymerase sigma factor (sigma-70 family)
MRSMVNDMSTEALVRAAAAGDVAARERLIGRYECLVQGTVRRFRLREADAQDAVQNTWLRMIEHIASLRDGAALPAWLVTTARRECLKILRSARREEVSLTADVIDQVTDPAPGPERSVVDRTMSLLLWANVGLLPVRGRSLLATLMAPDRPPYADVARSAGLPIGSIGPMRMRYLSTLRRHLEVAGLGAREWI